MNIEDQKFNLEAAREAENWALTPFSEGFQQALFNEFRRWEASGHSCAWVAELHLGWLFCL